MPRRCAIVGAGLAGLVAYTTLRHGGIEPAEIVVFGAEPDPAAFLSLAIPLCVFLAFQRYFAEGLLAGSVK